MMRSVGAPVIANLPYLKYINITYEILEQQSWLAQQQERGWAVWLKIGSRLLRRLRQLRRGLISRAGYRPELRYMRGRKPGAAKRGREE